MPWSYERHLEHFQKNKIHWEALSILFGAALRFWKIYMQDPLLYRSKKFKAEHVGKIEVQQRVCNTLYNSEKHFCIIYSCEQFLGLRLPNHTRLGWFSSSSSPLSFSLSRISIHAGELVRYIKKGSFIHTIKITK